MILIADIGGTKGDWCLVDGDKFALTFIKSQSSHDQIADI